MKSNRNLALPFDFIVAIAVSFILSCSGSYMLSGESGERRAESHECTAYLTAKGRLEDIMRTARS